MKKFKLTLLAFMAAMMAISFLMMILLLLQIRVSMKVIITSTFL